MTDIVTRSRYQHIDRIIKVPPSQYPQVYKCHLGFISINEEEEIWAWCDQTLKGNVILFGSEWTFSHGADHMLFCMRWLS